MTAEFDRAPVGDNSKRAIVAINVFALTEAIFGMLWKFAIEADVSLGDFSFVRTAIMFLLTIPMLLIIGKGPRKDMPWKLFPLVILRSCMGISALVGVTVALTMMPLSLTTIIFNLAPFWASILALLIHKESISKLEYLAMLITFAGVVGVVLGPNQNGAAWPNLTLGIAIGLVTSFGYAINNVLNRSLKEVHFSVLLFYHTLIGSMLCLLIFGTYSAVKGVPFLSNTREGWVIIVISGVLDFVCVGSMIIAYQSDTTAFVSLLGYSQVVYAFLIDIFVFKQTITGFQLFCALVICATTIAVALFKSQ